MTDYLQHPVGLDTPGVAAVMDELSLWSARFGLLLLEQVPLQNNSQILDLGCGTGFPGKAVYGHHWRRKSFR